MAGMNDFDFDAPLERRHTASLKWDRYGSRDIIPLWVADMDFRSPPAVMHALANRVEHGVFGYGTAPGNLTELVCSILASKYKWQVVPEHIVWLPGLVCGLNLACRAFGSEHDDILTMVPVYPPFLSAPKNSGQGLITVPLESADNRWNINFTELERKISRKTKLILFCNPHNPVGRVFSRQELEKIVTLCNRHDIIICSDEIHCDLILDPEKKHIPTATISAEAAARTITLMAPSKTFNIPGLGCSFAVITNRRLRLKFYQAMAGIVPEVNILGFTAAEAAYHDGWDWLDALLAYLRDNRRLVEKEIGAMENLFMHHVEATYLAWIDARRIDKKFPGRFFEAFGVGLSDGCEFGSPGFVRLNFGCPRSLLQEALQRIKQAMQSK
ncbi:MAG: PatB family C-S lyase [Desulfobulbales bacterium]|nr:PatB family C-S lyase [Desulfobulbales bacterium]